MAATKATILRRLFVGVMLLNFGYSNTEAKLLAMRPLSARKVYRLLLESGRADATPQGLTVGLTKGLDGAFIFNITSITPNVVAADLENAANGGSNSNSALTKPKVCCNSRNARSLEEAEAVIAAYSCDNDSKKFRSKVRPSGVKRIVQRKRRNKRLKKSLRRRYKRPNRFVLVGLLFLLPQRRL